MKIYVFGNGNISFEDFGTFYEAPIRRIIERDALVEFIVCEFRGTDALTLELLKSRTPNVTVLHVGDKPRYTPDKFKTKVSDWKFQGSYSSDAERDSAAIAMCTHFLACDFNSDENRKSGTLKNIEKCLLSGKIAIEP